MPGEINEPAKSVECLSQNLEGEVEARDKSEGDEAKSIPAQVSLGEYGVVGGPKDSGEVQTEPGWFKSSTILQKESDIKIKNS